jgi:hypothetical protein
MVDQPAGQTVEELLQAAVDGLRAIHRPWADRDFGKVGNNPHRTSGKYGEEAGWFGYGDCPSPDTHWDPGNMKWSVVLAQQIADTLGAPTSPSAGLAAMAAKAVA